MAPKKLDSGTLDARLCSGGTWVMSPEPSAGETNTAGAVTQAAGLKCYQGSRPFTCTGLLPVCTKLLPVCTGLLPVCTELPPPSRI